MEQADTFAKLHRELCSLQGGAYMEQGSSRLAHPNRKWNGFRTQWNDLQEGGAIVLLYPYAMPGYT